MTSQLKLAEKDASPTVEEFASFADGESLQLMAGSDVLSDNG
jgi:hypothetical protein